MVKRKPRQLAVPSESKGISSPSTALSEEDDWLIVKKQRITILIPPLHAAEQQAANAEACLDKIQAIPAKATKKLLQLPSTRDELEHAERGKARLASPSPITSSQSPKKVASKEHDLEVGKQPSSIHIQTISLIREKSIIVQGNRKPLSRPRRLLTGSTDSMDGGVFLDQLMRASNLDNKIRRAGGLSNWLASLGLHQFVRLFNNRRVDKFQLVNLTMKKLKDMGAEAVGPRRKLMHAIDCLCQPYCFESLRIATMQP